MALKKPSPKKQPSLRVIFIVGPTGVGKSEAAAELAKKINGEIISADSMQIYKGMDIGTAKPGAKLLKRVPHHLIDIVKPSQTFSVFQFYKQSLKLIRQIIRRGRVPLVVGGTGFYVRSLLQGLSSGVGADIAFRKKMEKLEVEKGPGYLYDELRKKDPARAEKINPRDQKRIIRALEIMQSSGKPASANKKDCKPLSELGYETRVFGLIRSREVLYANIEKRVEKMFRRGLSAEAKKILKNRVSKTSMHAVGYKEIWACFEKGISPEAAKEQIKINTRHYAKRQITWFQREQGIEWIPVEAQSYGEVAGKILKALEEPVKG